MNLETQSGILLNHFNPPTTLKSNLPGRSPVDSWGGSTSGGCINGTTFWQIPAAEPDRLSQTLTSDISELKKDINIRSKRDESYDFSLSALTLVIADVELRFERGYP